MILFFVGYNAGGENGCPSVPLLPPVLHCPFRRKKVKGLFFILLKKKKNDQFQFVGTKKKVQKCIDKISGQGERE